MKTTRSLVATRRAFLKRTDLATGGVLGLPHWISASARGAAGAVAPSIRVTVACIGLGNRGPDNLHALLPHPEVRVMGVCDVHETQRAHGKKLVDDHYGNRDCAKFKDYRELMARKDLDAVLICTPDHWHPLITIEAARQGKHVYCEKSIGWSVCAAQAVRWAVHDRKVVYQFGTQQRSDAKFRLACELVRNGRIGRLQTILVGVGCRAAFRSPTNRPSRRRSRGRAYSPKRASPTAPCRGRSGTASPTASQSSMRTMRRASNTRCRWAALGMR
ncbi:MAG: Gfo/Idh/MocA family oxidoreductase [Verrucomicrobiae bacterium]|nr:Gfo/Idh/MocA family oxidoreductase [Verrucomicrobiae bacterium]